MLELIEKLPFYYDEPYGDSSALPTIIVSRLARRTVTVALSADGGDEVFCGYSKYFFLNSFQNIFSNSFKKAICKIGLNIFNANSINYMNNLLPKNLKQKNIKDKYLKFKRAINSNNLEEMFENASSYEDKQQITDFLKITKNEKLFKKWGKINGTDFLEQMMAIDYKLFMNDDVLTKVDRATMSVSLEGRDPLLDHRLIEYLARVPSNMKYKNKEGKYLLKKILYKYIPKDIVNKQKSGFQIPLNEWLRGKLKPLVFKYLDDSRLDNKIFNLEEVDALKKKFFNGEDLGTTIWFILMYQMWKEKWLQ
jgi:asparagine synthase (glutamine-hydrolysing)